MNTASPFSENLIPVTLLSITTSFPTFKTRRNTIVFFFLHYPILNRKQISIQISTSKRILYAFGIHHFLIFFSLLAFGNHCSILTYLLRNLVRTKDPERSNIKILWLQLYLIKISFFLFKYSLSVVFYVLWRLLEKLTEKGQTDLL